MSIYLATAFVPAMLERPCTVTFEKCSKQDIPEKSFHCVHRPCYANILTKELGFKVFSNYKKISMVPGDVLYYCHFNGDVAGTATELPLGVSIEYQKITVSESPSNPVSESPSTDNG